MKVLCGPFQPALEKAFLDRLAALKPGPSRRVAVVAPSRRLADRLQRLVAREAGRALLGVRFHTFFSLASEVVEASGGPARPVVRDPLYHDLLVDQLLRQRGQERLTRGLGAAFRSSLRDLVDAGINPDRAADFADLSAPESAKTRLRLLFGLTASYQEALEGAGLMSTSGLTIQARRAVEQDPGVLAGYEEVLYYGFYDLTALQVGFFQAVSAARPTTLFYPFVKGHPGYKFAEPFVDEFLHAGGKAPEHLPPAAGGALGPAGAALFSPGAHAAADPDSVRFLSASGRRDEAWAAAQEVRRLHDELKIPFDDIGVAARVLEPYRAALTEAFTAHAIPFSCEDGDPLLSWPAARLCLQVATLDLRDYPAAAVLELAESPYFTGPRQHVASWRALIRRTGLHSGWLQWEGKVAPWADKPYPLERAREDGQPAAVIPPEATAALWAWVQALRDLHRSTSSSWFARSRKLQRLLTGTLAAEPRDPGAPALEAALKAAADLAIYDQLGLKAPTALQFTEAYEERLRRAALEAPRPARGVRVLDAMAARGDSFKALVVVGLEEGLFPRAAREDPLLPDDVRRVLRQQLGHWLHGKLDEGYDEERLLFTLLVSSARERLSLVWSRSDEKGRPRVPSPYLRDLAEAAGLPLDSSVVRVPRPLSLRLASAPRQRLAPREALFLMDGGEKGLDDFLKVLDLDAALYRSGRRALEPLAAFGKAGPHDGLVGHTAAAGKLLRRGLSPSALDDLAACPFMFFAKRLLRLPEEDGASGQSELSSQELGLLYHETLRTFYAEGYKGDWRPALAKAAEAVFTPDAWRPLGLYPVLWEAVRQRALARLERLLELDLGRFEAEGLYPARFEEALDGKSGELALRGRLDRVDLSKDGKRARVVDYKTRYGEHRQPKKVLKLSSTQPAVYLELLLGADWYKGGPGGVQGVEYLNIEDDEDATGRAWRQTLEGDDWREARETLRAALETLRGLLERGEFPLSPEEGFGGHCSYCSYARVCRKAHLPARRRAEGSDAIAALETARGETP
ncbi:PD-(D/E)XK nuclease family protein [bacterium]|nr:MAG: PD-(D/E)XK nuclease family protein [bacterium]